MNQDNEKFIITGPSKLYGSWNTAGSKNAILPILSACLLNIEGEVILDNVPRITDVGYALDILKVYGVKFYYQENGSLVLDSSNVEFKPIESSLSGKYRASAWFLGSALSRFEIASITPPGGDMIGPRPLDIHLDSFRTMGIQVEEEGDFTTITGAPQNATINTNFSVGATINTVLAAVQSSATIHITCAAAEPHVMDLANFLNLLGAQINGIGTHDLYIHGVKKLNGGSWRIVPDYLEAGTIAIAAAITRSELIINDFYAVDNQSLLYVFRKIGQEYQLLNESRIKLIPSWDLKPIRIKTNVFPGFPTDLQSPISILLTQCQGISSIFETIYDDRLNYLAELQKMGAKFASLSSNEAIIIGPTSFYGAKVLSYDVRAGMTLILAAMIAEGTTEILNISHVDRGYADIETRLRAIGVDISREKMS